MWIPTPQSFHYNLLKITKTFSLKDGILTAIPPPRATPWIKAFLKEKKKIIYFLMNLNLRMSSPRRAAQRTSLLSHPGPGNATSQNLASLAVELFIELGLMELFIEQCLMIFSAVEEFSVL